MRTYIHPLPFLLLFLTAPLFAFGQSGSFGNAIVLDQDELIIGEPNTMFREGSVYVYRQTEGEWVLDQRIVAPEAQRADGFGSVLAKTGDTLFIGQRNGPLHIYEKGVDGWRAAGIVSGNGTSGVDPGCNQYGYCGADFGIALATDGNWLLVGSPAAAPARSRRGEVEPARPAGAVYAFRRGADGEWTEEARLQPNSGNDGDRFGFTIHLADGSALIGAPLWDDENADLENVGRVTRFALQDGRWSEMESLTFVSESAANFGTAITVRGNKILVGAPGANESRGAVFTFERASVEGVVEPAGSIRLSDGEPGDGFGSGVGFSGADVWVGAPTLRENLTGSTFVFEAGADGSLPDTPKRIQLGDTVERDAFGHHIVANSSTVVVASPGMHHQSGAVFVYSSNTPEGEMLVSPPDALGAILGEERECEDGKIGPFECDEIELLSFMPNSILRAPENARGVRTNDNWGWTDHETGREYALVGRNDGTSFIDITDPANPVLIGDLPKPWGTPPSQLWRDIKTYRDHAFIVADGAGDHGMQVFDLTRLRDVTDPPALFEPDFHYRGIASSHNIIINEDTGFAYTVDRQTCGGGLYMINIQDPLNPTFAGCSTGERGTHDAQCVTYGGPDLRYSARELCLNSNGSEFEIVDVTDKKHPRVLSTATSPSAGYIHQGWLTDDQRYFYQDDESDVVRGNVPTTRTLVWDLMDLEDPILVTEFMGSLPASAHNLYLNDGFAYQANYRYGLHVLDIVDPENPVEVGFFDTTPYIEGPGFSGAWSTYPFFESGTVLVTSVQEGLFLLRKRKEAF